MNEFCGGPALQSGTGSCFPRESDYALRGLVAASAAVEVAADAVGNESIKNDPRCMVNKLRCMIASAATGVGR